MKSQDTPHPEPQHPSFLRWVMLPVAVAAPALPPLPAAMILLLIALPGLRRRPVFGMSKTAAGALVAAAVLLALSVERPPLVEGGTTSELRQAYADLWGGLEEAAAGAVAELVSAGESTLSRPVGFERLRRLAEPSGELTLLLLDQGGDALAWAGPGLVHEPEAGTPAPGPSYRTGILATTFFVTVPVPDVVGEGGRALHLVAGRSLDTDSLPPIPLDTGRWWLDEASQVPPPGVRRVTLEGHPALFLPADAGAMRWEFRGFFRSAAILLLFLGLLGPSFLRFLEGLALNKAGSTPWDIAALASGVGILGYLPAVPVGAAGLLAGGLGLVAWVLSQPPEGTIQGAAWGWSLGALVAPVLMALAWLYQLQTGPVDLAGDFGGGPEAMTLRLAFGLLALAGLALAGRMGGAERRAGAVWGTAVPLLLAAAAVDHLVVAIFFLVLGGVAASRMAPLARSPAPLLVLFAALLAASSWEVAERSVLRQHLGEDLLPLLEPPTDEDLNDLLLAFDGFFREGDLAERLGTSARLAAPDLAYALWRDSPLANRDGLSALIIDPDGGEPSSFAFGLALDENLELIPEPGRWRVPGTLSWRRALLFGEAPLTVGGEPWGQARYAFLPRPGFRLAVSEVEELEVALVRGEAHAKAVDGLPGGVLYGLYQADGAAIESPWEEAPPLQGDFLESAAHIDRLETPGGSMWAVKRHMVDGVAVLFTPVLDAWNSLERVGIHALGTLGVLFLAVAAALPLALPRGSFRQALGWVIGSYSRRLILVYTVLLLVPLIALNLILLRSFENRLRQEQLANAEAAIGSARHFLLDYLLGLKPGFGIDTQVNRPLLEWISSVVQHQVNLYWGSRVFASSQQELFTAGLSTRRVPGAVFSRLAFDGYDLASRTQRMAELDYLELYAPLDTPGLGLGQQGLFLSVPLLEQEEEVGRELAGLRRRAVLVSSALFLLLMAVGSRLARSFTKPIMELIDGTRSIARGADRLQVKPRENELSALAEAIDQMAREIADGRRLLVYEKQLMETIVDQITSGVVLLDDHGRVLRRNGVARELLGAEPGTGLEGWLEQRPGLEPLADFLGEVGDEPVESTVRLAEGEGQGQDWTLSWVPLPGHGEPAAILVVDDDTEVLRGQRLEAWAEMARLIAHEIKNPLTPIQLSTEHMRRVWNDDRERLEGVFERCTDNILRQVGELRELASDFSIYSRIPRAERVPGDLVEAVEELVAVYRDASVEGSEIEFHGPDEPLAARFDRKLLGRAVRNLMENALRANGGRGTIRVLLDARGPRASLRVADTGPGVDPKMLLRIFDPYFSTYDTGTGLGLAITRRIVEEHGGEIEARNLEAGGLEVELLLPLTPPAGGGEEGPQDNYRNSED